MNKLIVASLYANPLHSGHVRYLRGAKGLGDFLIVIVNNDLQAQKKKNRKSFMNESERLEIVRSIRYVDMAILSFDTDRSVSNTLKYIYSWCKNIGFDGEFVFANGGDVRNESEVHESEICKELGIELAFGVGGTEKIQSSSNLIRGITEN
jgi:cytidyltransferase-like protein